MKRYFVEYESDEKVCGSNSHTYASASTIKTAKGYFKRIREKVPNARNIRIYDSWADVDESTNFVPVVYREN